MAASSFAAIPCLNDSEPGMDVIRTWCCASFRAGSDGRSMNRRELLAFLGTVAALPASVLAQQPTTMRRLGVLAVTAGDDVIGQTRLAEALAAHGWKEQRQPQDRLAQWRRRPRAHRPACR